MDEQEVLLARQDVLLGKCRIDWTGAISLSRFNPVGVNS